uniref:Reverse transcriptase domain-containing protein n=1 Tax=Tanacetum cinerariifolium TaxID=118510 RepID=A0A699KJT2_TANCI|nr:reverse transcriptase domain-containing protein [Tanacetum cinerariifolium]
MKKLMSRNWKHITATWLRFRRFLQQTHAPILTSRTVETNDSNVIPDSPDMCEDDIQNDQNDVESDDEPIKKANTTLAQEIKEYKAILAETSKSLGESISVRDSCLVALQTNQTEFEKYKAFNDRTIDCDKIEQKLNETLGQLALKEIEIKEGLKTKANEILVVKQKHDELMKQSLLTKSHYEGLVKQKTKRFPSGRDEPHVAEIKELPPHLEYEFLEGDDKLPVIIAKDLRNYMPEVRKELKICEAHSKKSSVDEPHVAELKELPPHLEYAFLEGDDKLSVIIEKDLSVEEKTALITILNSHKRAIAWKLSDIKGINPKFCTHKILMEEDFEPAVQHQRGVNPKIHDVIKQEVIKLLEAGLI